MSDSHLINKYLIEGKVILYPTDTVWGLGCDATNPDAVAKIFTIKQRNESKSLIILVNNTEMLQQYIAELPQKAIDYLKTITTPTTIIYNNPIHLAQNVIASDNTVAIRIVNDYFCQQIITNFGKPIVSTSANISGEPTPQFFKAISPAILAQADYIVPFRQNETDIKKPSRLVKFTSSGELIILRE